MARSLLLCAAAAVCTLGAGPVAAQATTSSSMHRKARCAAARSSGARSGTLSFHKRHCTKGRKHVHRGAPSHLLFFTATNGRCQDSGLAPNASDVAEVRAATLCLVNRERAARGEHPLHWNDRMVAAAQKHTESMAFGDYFEHVGPHGETPLSRMRRTGYISSSRLGFEIAENIGWGSLWLGTPRAIVAAWMSDSGHRANILDRRFRDTGIGVSSHVAAFSHGQSGGIYTQDFGVIVGG
jgi:uncharacterized protein YkwD